MLGGMLETVIKENGDPEWRSDTARGFAGTLLDKFPARSTPPDEGVAQAYAEAEAWTRAYGEKHGLNLDQSLLDAATAHEMAEGFYESDDRKIRAYQHDRR